MSASKTAKPAAITAAVTAAAKKLAATTEQKPLPPPAAEVKAETVKVVTPIDEPLPPPVTPPAPVAEVKPETVKLDPQAEILADFENWDRAGEFTYRHNPTLATLQAIAKMILGKPQAGTARGGLKSAFSNDSVIRILVDKNRRQEGSAAHARFAKFQDGMTVAQFLAACADERDPRGTVSKSIRRGWIKVDPPAK